jgi:hypothetical protein
MTFMLYILRLAFCGNCKTKVSHHTVSIFIHPEKNYTVLNVLFMCVYYNCCDALERQNGQNNR